jgi:branched-chain amino acid transport system substrate-binding protein
MLRRAFVLLLGTLALAGCGGGYGYGPGGAPVPLGGGPAGGPAGHRVAILLPLSGARADIGQALLHGAQLALDVPGAPPLDVKDTGGTADGAAAAAHAAIADGAGLILGPLTSAETAAVAPIARAANVAVLAFTNDPSQAQPGVWPLGITPGQQMRRVVAAAQSQGKSQFAALLPDSDFGHVMGQALTQATGASGSPEPEIRYYASGMSAINAAARGVSGYASRRGPIDAQMRAARAEGTPEGRHQAQELAKSSVPPPSFNALLLADTGEALSDIASLLPYYDIDRSAVQIVGPAQLWASSAGGSGQFPGAWYAAPDPAARANFAQAYSAKNGGDPSPIADLAYDAASIARALGRQGFSVAALTQPAGFIGADGWFALLPDGQVRRALAVFAIERGGAAQMVEPAPQSGNVPGA